MIFKKLVSEAVTGLNPVTSDGLAARPAGRLGDVTRKLSLLCSSPARGRGEIGRRTGLKIPRPTGCAGSSPAVRTRMITGAGVCALAMLTAGCDPRPDQGPVVISGIGADAVFTPNLPRSENARLLTSALAQGLVRFDAAGQIEPGLAERWIVIDGGLRYIFRLKDARWDDDRPVTTAQVVTILKRRIADPANPLAPYLTAIDEVVEMTPQVLEVRLDRPRPDLLKLFAQPELALARARPPGGAGPFTIVAGGPALLLRPLLDPTQATDEEGPTLSPEDDVRVFGERAARAVARFVNRDSDLVLGGTFADWPVVLAAAPAPANIRTDPAAGLFGLAVVRREGFLANPAERAAVAGAIDRAAIAGNLPAGTPVAEAILPDRLDSAASPVQPAWSTLPFGERQATARQLATAWRNRTGAAPRLAIALPPGPGAAALFRRLRYALGQVGIEADRTPYEARDADLRLIDRVAPYDSARWYLRTACAPCGAEAEAAIEAARIAPSSDERARAIALADAALDRDVAFIPLLRPVRWSLVSLRLAGFQGNPRAVHPLDQLRNETD